MSWTVRALSGSPSLPTRICRAAPRRWRPCGLDCAIAASTGCPSRMTRSAGTWPAGSVPTVTGTAGSTFASRLTRYGSSGSIPTSPAPPLSDRPRPAGGTPPPNATLGAVTDGRAGDRHVGQDVPTACPSSSPSPPARCRTRCPPGPSSRPSPGRSGGCGPRGCGRRGRARVRPPRLGCGPSVRGRSGGGS